MPVQWAVRTKCMYLLNKVCFEPRVSTQLAALSKINAIVCDKDLYR